MYKKHYSYFANVNQGIQHYASFNHHCWPDTAVANSYFDIIKTQNLIAEILNLSSSEKIIFNPNMETLFNSNKNVSILTSDSESYSFAKHANIEKVSTMPFDDFHLRVINKIKANFYDVIFLSHIFFNSGMTLENLNEIVDAATDSKTVFIFDGTHAFLNLPTNLNLIKSRIFYFVQIDNDLNFIAGPKSLVSKDQSFNLNKLYATLKIFHEEKITVEEIHAHLKRLKNNFREHLLSLDHFYLTEKNILSVDYNHHGPFLTFAMPSPKHAKNLRDELYSHNILTDCLESRLRFTFGLYQHDVIDLRALKIKC